MEENKKNKKSITENKGNQKENQQTRNQENFYDEETLNYEEMLNLLREYQQQYTEVSFKLNNLNYSLYSLEHFEEIEDNQECLFEFLDGIFIRGKVIKENEFYVLVGNSILTKKNIEETKDYITKQINEFSREMEKIEKNIEKIETIIEKMISLK